MFPWSAGCLMLKFCPNLHKILEGVFCNCKVSAWPQIFSVGSKTLLHFQFKGNKRRFSTPQCQTCPLRAIARTVEVIVSPRARLDPIQNVHSCGRDSTIQPYRYRNIVCYLITLEAVWPVNWFSLIFKRTTPRGAPDPQWPEVRKSMASPAIFVISQPIKKHPVGSIFSWLANMCSRRLTSWSLVVESLVKW